MLILILIFICFIPAIFFANNLELPKEIETQKAIAWLPIIAIIVGLSSAVYSYYMTRKMQKQNRPEPNQLDGSIADEGVSFSSIFGSPHIHGNIVWKGDESTEAIKSKGGKK